MDTDICTYEAEVKKYHLLNMLPASHFQATGWVISGAAHYLHVTAELTKYLDIKVEGWLAELETQNHIWMALRC